jgi:hypothetical protein
MLDKQALEIILDLFDTVICCDDMNYNDIFDKYPKEIKKQIWLEIIKSHFSYFNHLSKKEKKDKDYLEAYKNSYLNALSEEYALDYFIEEFKDDSEVKDAINKAWTNRLNNDISNYKHAPKNFQEDEIFKKRYEEYLTEQVKKDPKYKLIQDKIKYV